MTDEPPKQGNHQEKRNRSMLISKVHAFWIKNVLEKSFEPGEKHELNWKMRPDLFAGLRNRENNQTGCYKRQDEIVAEFERSGKKLLILGETGAGKTICLLELARGLLEVAEQDDSQPVPVVLHLSSWKEGRSFEKWVTEELQLKYQTPRQISLPWLDEDRLTLLLDGLDELRLERRPSCVKAINLFLHKHSCGVVVCCQNAEYLQLVDQLELRAAIEISLPGSDQITAFLQRKPDKQLIEEYIQAMYNRLADNLWYAPEQLTGWLSWLARCMIQHGKTIFLTEELQVDWLPPGKAQEEYRKAVVWAILVPILACFLISAIFFFSALDVEEVGFIYIFLILWFAVIVYNIYTSTDLIRINHLDDLNRNWNWSQIGKLIIICLGYGDFWAFFPLLAILSGFSKEKIDPDHTPGRGIRRSGRLALATTLISLLSFVLPLIGILGLFKQSIGGNITFRSILMVVLPIITLPPLGIILGLGGKTVLQHAILRRLLVTNQRLPHDLSCFFNDAKNCGFLFQVGNGYLFKHRQLMDHFASLDKTASEEALDLVNNAEFHKSHGNYEQAIAIYSEALEIPGWEKVGKFNRQDIQNEKTDCSIALAQALIEEGYASDAVSIFEATVARNEGQREKITQLSKEAREQRAANNLHKAQQCTKTWQALYFYNKALELTDWPGVEQAWLGQAECFLEIRNYQACIEHCNQALVHGADESQTRAIRGEAYYHINQFDLASKDLSVAIKQNSGDDWTLALNGDALRRTGNTSDAGKLLDKAIELAPEDELYLAWRGLSHLASGFTQDALEDFKKYWDLSKNFDRIYANFLCALANRANQRQALAYLQDAIEQAEKLHDRWYHWENAFNLALYYLASDDLESATELYLDILENQPPLFQTYKAMRKLEDFRQIVPEQLETNLFLAQLREYVEVGNEDHQPSIAQRGRHAG